MGTTPIATPQTEGRVFGTDWSIGNVAKLLRANAARGAWRPDSAGGGYAAKINQHYVRTVSARHLPTQTTLMFMRLESDKSWYASLCFANSGDYLPWNRETADQWLLALFGEAPPQLLGDSTMGDQSGVLGGRQFTLAKIG